MKRVTPGLPALEAIDRLAERAVRVGTVEVLVRVDALPIHAFRFGTADPTAPTAIVWV